MVGEAEEEYKDRNKESDHILDEQEQYIRIYA